MPWIDHFGAFPTVWLRTALYQSASFGAKFSGCSGFREGRLPYSMTGFGAAEGPVAGRRLRVEIRTVNHRYFNLSAKLPGDLGGLEGEVRERLRRDFDRGHITVHARWGENLDAVPGFTVDLERARLVTSRLRELQSALGLGGEVTVELVARQPDVLTSGADAANEIPWVRWSLWSPGRARSAGHGRARAKRSQPSSASA